MNVHDIQYYRQILVRYGYKYIANREIINEELSLYHVTFRYSPHYNPHQNIYYADGHYGVGGVYVNFFPQNIW